CRTFDRLIADAPIAVHPPLALAGLRFAVPTTLMFDDIDDAVARDFERAVSRLSAQGARIERLDFPELAELPALNARGSLVNAEPFEVHRAAGLLDKRKGYDANVIARIEIGARMSANQVAEIRAARTRLQTTVDARAAAYDALLCPTVATVPPRLRDLDDP